MADPLYAFRWDGKSFILAPLPVVVPAKGPPGPEGPPGPPGKDGPGDGGVRVTVGPDAPADPKPGDLWIIPGTP